MQTERARRPDPSCPTGSRMWRGRLRGVESLAREMPRGGRVWEPIGPET